MTFPDDIPTRTVTLPGSTSVEDGSFLEQSLLITASRPLIWAATGWRFLPTGVIRRSFGGELTLELPRTDVAGWRDADTGALIDVTAPGSFTHTYTATVLRDPGERTELGEFVLPAGAGPVDLGSLLPVGTEEGRQVSVPDSWTPALAAVQQELATRLSEESLASTFVAPSLVTPAASMGFLGDSNTQANGNADNAGGADRGFFHWAAIRLRQRLGYGINTAVYGERTDQILGRVPAVLASPPGWCHVMGGTNDVNADVSYATIIANLGAIYDALTAADIRIVAGTIFPASGLTSGRRAIRDAVNRWIKQQSRTRPNLIVADYYGALADPATGDWKSGMNYDGLHINAQGAAECGRVLAELMATRVSPLDILPAANTEAGFLIPNGLMQGNASGVATGWTVTQQSGGASTATKTKVARTDGLPGEWQQVVIPSGENVRITYAMTSSLPAVGTRLRAYLECQADANLGTPTRFRLELICRDAGFAVLAQSYGFAATDATPANWLIADGVRTAPTLVVPSGTTRIEVALSVTPTAGGTVRAGRAALVVD